MRQSLQNLSWKTKTKHFQTKARQKKLKWYGNTTKRHEKSKLGITCQNEPLQSLMRPNKSDLWWNTIWGNCKEKQCITNHKEEENNYTTSIRKPK